MFDPKGEYVLIVDGNTNTPVNELLNKSIIEHLNYYISLGESKNDAIKKVARERGLSKNEVYQKALSL